MAFGGPGGSSSTGGGLSKFGLIGVTTAAFVRLFTNTGLNGIMGIGTIKNTDGANTLTVRETAVDMFGNTVAVSTDVGPGDSYLLDPQTYFGAALPPYSSYKIEVEDKVAASHATFEIHYSGLGTIA